MGYSNKKIIMKTLINNKWELELPEHRANRPGWDFWEKERNAAMYAAIRQGDVIVDIGAEEGDLSAMYAKWAGELGKIVLIEPSARMWPWIKDVFEMNNLTPYLNFHGFVEKPKPGVVYECSLVKGEWPLAINSEKIDEPGFKHLNEDDPDIKRTTLDMLFSELEKIDIVTIDTEGSELEILKGGEKLLATKKAIFFISVHPEFMRDRYGDTPDDLLVFMDLHGYDATYLAYDHEKHYMFKPRV